MVERATPDKHNAIITTEVQGSSEEEEFIPVKKKSSGSKRNVKQVQLHTANIFEPIQLEEDGAEHHALDHDSLMSNG